MRDLDRRNFYLMLSVPQGQELAKIAGYHPASSEVAARETEEIAREWIHLYQHGIVHSSIESAEWFYEVIHTMDGLLTNLTAAEREEVQARFIASLAAFAVAHTHKMKSEGIIHL